MSMAGHATRTHALTWFEIPVRDLDRAQRFYETVLATALHRDSIGSETMAIFPSADGGVRGCIAHGPEQSAPAAAGTRVYLDAGPSLDAALRRVPGAGGRIATPRTALPPGMGFFAHVIDTEGNLVGLHAMA